MIVTAQTSSLNKLLSGKLQLVTGPEVHEKWQAMPPKLAPDFQATLLVVKITGVTVVADH